MTTTGSPGPALPSIVRYPGRTALAIADQLCQAYAEVFSQPPWNEDHTRVEEFRHRLDTDAHRPGFRAVIATGTGRCIDGFATGWIRPSAHTPVAATFCSPWPAAHPKAGPGS
ncbi:hypothetical protein [Nonomuraea sp. NEAU-A123]|uniref:hypothetical protein n=1 Tax=Nonomuraea sp. NEAU-A123 TaxID=2839649 RepID=UPI001BE3CFFE|nr:hypothetical protein [Nonomuraea sp. NEAU-A123]MBT2225072.1 hypothetical protein [Nonomuraea sp. NEAU-A123]